MKVASTSPRDSALFTELQLTISWESLYGTHKISLYILMEQSEVGYFSFSGNGLLETVCTLEQILVTTRKFGSN